MKKWLLDILQLNILRSLWHRLSHPFADEVCHARFVAEMNKWSSKWGLNRTEWINASGIGEDEAYSTSTANDLSLMALRAFAMGGGFNIVLTNMN